MAGELLAQLAHGLLETQADQVSANPNIGQVSALALTGGGSGYTSNFTPTYSAPGGSGTTASGGTATVSGGKVTSVSMPTNPGSGYTSPPTINLNGGGGTGATATVYINQPMVTLEFSAPALFPTLVLVFFGGNATVGTAYEGLFVASGGNPPYTFAITSGSLPPGLSLTGSTGVISGTIAATGSYTFTCQVTDIYGATASCVATIVVAQGGANVMY